MNLKSYLPLWHPNNKNYKLMGKNQHVVKHSNGWAVRGAGNEKATKVTQTQNEAIQYAKQIASNQNSEMLVHGRDGRIRERNSYGNDPHPPKG
ncbi:DUF2188 domain-containing protein [Rufibacter quisquiliarum]|uniref:DUF2188 domain-containing protein n=1 Tax=Rufibacter quisquiliarum TaxID=1549639 RepID=A0A839GNG4_9BACT|nr:DUF2188 domain-containing protein [Rufibacter quisquiliarum]MBA9077085.1 hypothetical protein [Rufibacter quisquiliarum]